MIKEEHQNKTGIQDKRILTLFLVLFPSIIIAANWGISLMANIALKAMLIFYQFVILKVFLDNYYGYK